MDKDVVAASEEALAPFGEFYESLGVRFFRALNSRVGVRSDKVKAFTGTVEKLSAQPEGWLQVKLQGQEQGLIIYHNWTKANLEFRTGENVEGVMLMDDKPPRALYVKRLVTTP